MSAVDPWVREHITRGHLPTQERVARIAESQRLRRGSDGAAELQDQLSRSVLGLGPLEALVQDEQVTDLVVNGVHGVYVDRGAGLSRAEVDLSDERALRRLAVRLAGQAGQRLDDACPTVDGLLPGGVRLHALLPPLVEGGAHISLRIPRRTVPRLATLCAWGLCDTETEGLLGDLVRRRVSFVIGGGTGSGKTTLLAALLSLVPAQERIVVVEDTRELRVDHPHVVHLQGRGANVEGRGEVDLVTLVRQSLRMRPDRIVLGEVRGAEVRELLAALNTGHEGGCGTVHANSARDVVTRFEALGALAGLDAHAVHAQLASAVRVVLHLGRVAGRREVTQIAVLQRSSTTGVVAATLAMERVEGTTRRGPAWSLLQDLLRGEAA